jgi:putative transposase
MNEEKKYYRSHKTRIYPTKEQESLLFKSIGTARFAFNWGLEMWNEMYNNGEKPSGYTIRNEFIKLKDNPEYKWLKEVSKETYSNSILDMAKAWSNYFKRSTKGKPRFKSRKNIKQSYTENSIHAGYLQWIDNRLFIPKFRKKYCLKTSEFPRFKGEVKKVVISYRAGYWFASVLFEMSEPPIQYKRHKVKTNKVGIDLGVKVLATMSDGCIFEKIDTKAIDKKIEKQQHRLSKKKKSSKNRLKARTKLQRLYLRKENIVKDNLHKATNFVVRHYNKIVLEDLKSSNMMKNHKLARSIANAQFYELRRQVEYKANYLHERRTLINVLFAEAFYPSSKTCSHCGHKKDKLSLSERTFKCEKCGFVENRDLNAAKNLCKLIA